MALEEILDINCGNLPMSEQSIKVEFCPVSLRGPGFRRLEIKRDWSEVESAEGPPHKS